MMELFDEKCIRRDRIQVFSDIIQAAKIPTKTTKIMRKANIQYHIFFKMVQNLMDYGLLEKNGEEKPTFVATNMGVVWSREVHRLYSILKDSTPRVKNDE